MNYNDKLVGDVDLVPNAPAWLVQLAGAVANVDRSEYLRYILQFNEGVQAVGRKRAAEQVRSLVAQYELEKDDVFGARTRAAVAPKYRDRATGKTWSGRGKAPRWLEGKNKEDFKV